MKKKTFREIRNEQGLTASYVAKKLGVCNYTLLAKERGDRSFNAKQVQDLCKIYNVGIEQIRF